MKTFCLGALLFTFSLNTALAASIPAATGTALDGHTVTLPRDLAPRATILILGFTERSKDATTLWEQHTHNALAAPGIGYFDIPFLQDAPGFIRPFIVRSIRKQVPDLLKPRFVPLLSGEPAWKQAAHFTPADPDAAYILLVDSHGIILWQTHAPYSPALLAQLSTAAQDLPTR